MADCEYPSREDIYELIYKSRNGDNDAAEKLIKLNTGLVKSLAVKFTGMGYELEDLIQIGYMGFLKAIERFEPERGLMLSTYAVPMILGEIKRYIRDDGRIKMSRQLKQEIKIMRKAQEEFSNEIGRPPKISELAVRMGVDDEKISELMEAQDALYLPSLDDEENTAIQLEGSISSYDDEDKKVDMIYLKSVIRALDERERQVIVLRYFRDLTQQQISACIGISQVQVSRIEKKVLAKLKKDMMSI